MHFRVVFKTPNGEAVVDKIGKAGTDIVDLIMEENPILKEIRLERIHIDDDCPLHGDSYSIDIPLDMARESGLFRGTSKIAVYVNPGFMSRFITFKTDIDYRQKQIDEVHPFLQLFGVKEKAPEKYAYSSSSSYKFDEAALIEYWKEQGFPESMGGNKIQYNN